MNSSFSDYLVLEHQGLLPLGHVILLLLRGERVSVMVRERGLCIAEMLSRACCLVKLCTLLFINLLLSMIDYFSF